jgi:hypothetical protein
MFRKRMEEEEFGLPSTGKETLNGIFVRVFEIDAEKRNICSCKSEVG